MFAALSAMIIIVVLGAIALTVWQSLSSDQQSVIFSIGRDHFGYLFAAVFLVMAALGFGLDAIFHMYILPLNSLAEETEVIFTSNPVYRLGTQMGSDLNHLAAVINRAADQHLELKTHIDEKIAIAKKEAESEKNILAAIMAEMPEGVLICNISGSIILYNRQAKQMFSKPVISKTSLTQSRPSDRYVGLGRSIFNLIDKTLIIHAIHEAQDRLDRDMGDMASYFIAPAGNKILYKVEMVPILDKSRVITGFILIFKEITEDILYFKTIDSVMDSYSLETRNLLTEILEFMKSDAGSPPVIKEVWTEFRDTIIQRSKGLEQRLLGLSSLFKEKMSNQWPMISLPGEHLFETLQKHAAIKHDIRLNVTGYDRKRRFQVEPYSFTAMVMHCVQRISDSSDCTDFELTCAATDGMADLTLSWDGPPVSDDNVMQWLQEQLIVDGTFLPLTLDDVLGLHHGCIHQDEQPATPRAGSLTFSFKQKEQQIGKPKNSPLIITRSRPEFYDFKLFDRNGHHQGMSDMELTRLSYTAFDSETTGLDPDHGDEIISLAAVRIVNAKVQYNETFEQLIDPGRTVPLESVRIHGITTEMVLNKPSIDKILPGFYLFTEETVLLGHNIAFDMKMLQKYEAVTGIRFKHPILDTLLLSAVANPVQRNHTMENIARRLGVNIMGRHTALGDALATAEIFLRLIPLLNQKGIVTLKDAVAASKKTYYARLKY